MNAPLLSYLADKIQLPILSYNSISGGDISKAYVLKTNSERFFCKVNTNDKALDMFQQEKKGLEAIGQKKCIKVPKVIGVGSFKKYAFLVLEYIESKSPSEKEMANFGYDLARLHTLPCIEAFGFEANNFIGILRQSNNNHKQWVDFYLEERLQPQLQLALQKELLNRKDVPLKKTMQEALDPLLNNCQPSLLHGDLWSGNYIIDHNGIAYLIDPAVYYGHHEVDITMTKLFGGFSESFYNAYEEVLPHDIYTNQHIELYQLYYLLIHLNMFGNSYYASVKRLLSSYFS